MAHAKTKEIKSHIDQSLAQLKEAEKRLRPNLVGILTSTKTKELLTAIEMIGQIGHPDDLAAITPFLLHESTLVRETTAVALGRMGDAAIPFMKETMKSGPVSSKVLVMAAMPHATSKKAMPILKLGFTDKDPSVQLTAISVLNNLPPVLKKQRPSLVKYAHKKTKKSPHPDIRFAASFLK